MCSFQGGRRLARLPSSAKRGGPEWSGVCVQTRARRLPVPVERPGFPAGGHALPSSLSLEPSGIQPRGATAGSYRGGGTASLRLRQSGPRNRTSEPPNIVPSPAAFTGARRCHREGRKERKKEETKSWRKFFKYIFYTDSCRTYLFFLRHTYI